MINTFYVFFSICHIDLYDFKMIHIFINSQTILKFKVFPLIIFCEKYDNDIIIPC